MEAAELGSEQSHEAAKEEVPADGCGVQPVTSDADTAAYTSGADGAANRKRKKTAKRSGTKRARGKIEVAPKRALPRRDKKLIDLVDLTGALEASAASNREFLRYSSLKIHERATNRARVKHMGEDDATLFESGVSCLEGLGESTKELRTELLVRFKGILHAAAQVDRRNTWQKMLPIVSSKVGLPDEVLASALARVDELKDAIEDYGHSRMAMWANRRPAGDNSTSQNGQTDCGDA